MSIAVPEVGVARGRPQRLASARSRRSGSAAAAGRAAARTARRASRRSGLVRHPLAVEQPADEPDRLVEPVEPLAEARSEVDPERVVLALEPAAAEAEDEPAVGQVVERSSRAWRSGPGCGTCWRRRGGRAGPARSGRPAPPASPSPRAWGRSDRPRRRAGGRRSRASPSRPLDGQAGIAKIRPARPVDPERRPEPHDLQLRIWQPGSSARTWPPSPTAILGDADREPAQPQQPPVRLVRDAPPALLIRGRRIRTQSSCPRRWPSRPRIERVRPRLDPVRGPLPDGPAGLRRRRRTSCSGLAGPRLQPAGAQPVALPRGRSSTIMAAACRRPRRTRGAARASGPTRPGRSRRSPSGRRSAPSTRTSGASSARSSGVPSQPAGLPGAADALVSRDQPGRWIDAVMDLGATCAGPRAALRGCPLAWLLRVPGAGRLVAHRAEGAGRPRSRPTTRWLRGSPVAAAIPGDRRWLRGAHPRSPAARRRRATRSASIGGTTRPRQRDGLRSDGCELATRPVRRRLAPASRRRADPGAQLAAAGLRLRFAGDARHCPAHRPPTPPRRCPPTIRRSSSWTCAGSAATGRRGPPCRPISAETMTGADRRAQALGVPEERLMEHAGTAVAAAVRALAIDLGRWGTGPIVILCGPGNNGGDGFVAARRLALAGASVIVAVVAAEARAARRVGRPQLGSDRARHRDRQGPPAGRPRRGDVRARASRRPRSSSTPCSEPASAAPCASRSARPSRSSAGRGPRASRSSRSIPRPRSTSRAASRRTRRSGPT